MWKPVSLNGSVCIDKFLQHSGNSASFSAFGVECVIHSQVTPRLLQACCLAVIKLIARVTMHLHRLVRVDNNKSVASCHQIDASCFNILQEVYKYQVAPSLIFTDLIPLDEANRVDTTS